MARMLWQDACRFDPSLASLDHFFSSPPDHADILAGGLTNRCWKVTLTDQQQFVWRPHSQVIQAFAISRYQEHRVLTAIQSLGVGPKPYAINTHGLLVEWVEGEACQVGVSFDAVLKLLIQTHQIPPNTIPVLPFNYAERVPHYWSQLGEDVLSDNVRQLYQRWQSPPSIPAISPCLCHFDLAGYNMIKTSAGYRAIDWEYASIADPRLDLMLSIAASEEKLLESVYRYCQLRGIEQVDDWVEGVTAWQPRTALLAMLWYLLAYQLWGDEMYLDQAHHIEKTAFEPCDN